MIAGLSDNALLAFLKDTRVLGDLGAAVLRPMPVSYTGRFWDLRTADRTYVIKEFYPGLEDNPLYPTLPDHEASALHHLERLELSPTLEAFLQSPSGSPLLIYGYIPALSDEIDVRQAADLVAHLAAQDVPERDFQQVPAGAPEVLAQGDAILSRIPESKRAVNLVRLKPNMADLAGSRAGRRTLVHRSLCLGTVLATREGPRVIDWQYAGIGDPVEDLVCFLSPGLAKLYGARPLALDAEDVFLAHYPDRDIIARFDRERIAYHWRLAAYCLYRQESLVTSNAPAARAYDKALEEEVDLILRLRSRPA